MLLALLASLTLTGLSGEQPSHPAINEGLGGSPMDIVLLYLLGVVWAPVVEELVFRGAFYYSLRPTLATILAALLNAFVFAAIHPQGWALIPALASLGFAFSLIREWRGSIIGPITAHAVHNGFLITTITLVLT